MESLLDYLDIFEDLLDNGKAVPFSNKTSVNREKMYDIINEIRLNIPNEIRQAQKIIEDHDRIINDAKTKAAAIIREAENDAKMMTNSHEIYKMATEQASEIMEEAKKSARDMRLNAMDYADEILAKTESMIREAMGNLEQQHRIMDDYFSRTVDVLYQNRQELRGNK